MSAENTPSMGLNFGYITGENGWGDGVNANWMLLDAVAVPFAKSATLNLPPVGAVQGDRYLIPADAQGQWEGRGGKLATWFKGQWVYFTPRAGWYQRAWDTRTTYVFDGSAWVVYVDTISPEVMSKLNSAVAAAASISTAAADVAADKALVHTEALAAQQSRTESAASAQAAANQRELALAAAQAAAAARSDSLLAKDNALSSAQTAGYAATTATAATVTAAASAGEAIAAAASVATSAQTATTKAGEANNSATTATNAANSVSAAAAILAALPTSSGSNGIGFRQSGTGAVDNTAQAKLRERVTPQDYMSDAQRADVAGNTGSLDVVAAFEKAILTGQPVYVPTGKYLFSRQLLVPSNTSILGNQSQIVLANNANQHVIRVADDASNVRISGLRIDGRKANNVSGGHGIACNGGTNIRISENIVSDCVSAGIYFAGTFLDRVSATNNFVTGCGSGGITANSTVTHFAFNGNHAWLNGTHGVGILGVAKHGTINDNVCWDNGQGTPNADNITGYAVENQYITVTGNSCSGGLNNGIHMGGSFITISSNVVHDPAQHGIVMRPNTGIGDDCVMTGNTVYSAGGSGFWIENCNSGSVSGNVSRDNAGHGFLIDGCTNIAFTGNTARGNATDGFRTSVASAYLTFTGNTSRSNGSDGIELGNLTDSSVVGNVFNLNTGYGINVSGTEGRNVIVGNTVRNNTAGAIVQPNVTTRVNDNETGQTRTLPSAATMTLWPGGSYFYITGTTNISNLSSGFTERLIVLQFDDVLTMVDGGNLSLAGNFVTAFKRTITLMWDGGKWNEIARSSN